MPTMTRSTTGSRRRSPPPTLLPPRGRSENYSATYAMAWASCTAAAPRDPWRLPRRASARFRTRTSGPSRPISPISTAGRSPGLRRSAVALAMSYAALGAGQDLDPEARLYIAACASCHYNSGAASLARRARVGLQQRIEFCRATNLIQIILRGIDAKNGIPGVVMPGFARALSDADIASIAGYLRRTRTILPPWPDLPSKIATMRQTITASQ